MLVFGDAERNAAPHAEIARIRATLDDAATAAPAERREPILCAFVLASELAQGLADAEAALETAPINVLRALADLLLRQTDASFHATRDALDALAATALPDRILCRRQEGFAFYGVSPEAYADAARQTPGVEAVIGVRSIGIGLAAMVAAASAAAFVTSLRPTGPPLRREARFSSEVAARLKRATGLIAVVDEGPGFSGSSFLAVVRALLELGAPLHRIVLFPSHGAPPRPRRRSGAAGARSVPDSNRRRRARSGSAANFSSKANAESFCCGSPASAPTAPPVSRARKNLRRAVSLLKRSACATGSSSRSGCRDARFKLQAPREKPFWRIWRIISPSASRAFRRPLTPALRCKTSRTCCVATRRSR